MYPKKIKEDLDCGLRVAFKVFGGKWKMCILDAINKGFKRPVEMQKIIGAATMRVIEMQLAELLQYGVIDKTSDDGYPRKTEYRITEMGRTILPLLSKIDQWGTANAAFVKERNTELLKHSGQERHAEVSQ